MSEHEMHRWTDRDGNSWECDAYDHGPFCRQCRMVEIAAKGLDCDVFGCDGTLSPEVLTEDEAWSMYPMWKIPPQRSAEP